MIIDDVVIDQTTQTINIKNNSFLKIINNSNKVPCSESTLFIYNAENNDGCNLINSATINTIACNDSGDTKTAAKMKNMFSLYKEYNDFSDFSKNISAGNECEINISGIECDIKMGDGVKQRQKQQIIRKEVLLNTATNEFSDVEKCNYNEILRILQYQSIALFKSQKAIEILIDFITANKYRCIFNINDPGTGKTISIITFIFRLNELIMLKRIEPLRVCLLSFARTVFINDLIRSPDFNYIPISAHLTGLTQDEKKTIGKNMYFDSYGYRQFASRVLEITNEVLFNQYIIDNARTDPMEVLNHLSKIGIVKINHDFVKKINNTVVIVDEGQRLQNSSWINHYGYALICIRDLTNAFFIYISATILNSKNTELAFVQRLLNDYY